MTTIQILRLPTVVERGGTAKSTLYREIKNGLFPPPVRIGERASGWPASEVDAILSARISGKSSDEIRALVQRLVAARSEAA